MDHSTIGTLTVMFSDLVGSTELRHRVGEDKAEQLRSVHDRVVTEAIRANGGRVAKHLGDGFMATFTSAAAAVAAAVAVQQGLDRVSRNSGSEPLLARVGLSCGDVTMEGDDCFGGPVVEAQRLESSAGPGTIRCADIVRVLARGRGSHTFRSLGAITLRGIPEPVLASEVTWEPSDHPPSITVVVADDALLIREGIVRLLDGGGFRVVGEAADYDSLLETVESTMPALVVTDIRMPPTNTDEGLRAAASIRAAHPDIAVLVLSQHIETRAAAGLFDGRPAGIGYLLKERVSDLSDFLDAARTVAAGGSVIDPSVADQLLRRRRNDDALTRLTDRERDVLRLMAQGKANAIIAAELFISSKTLETHVRAIFDKLDMADNNPDDNRRVLAVIRWLEAAR